MWLDELRWRAHERRWPLLYQQWLADAVAFDITAVSQYLMHPGTPYPKDIPNVAPLAPAMYFEWQMHTPVSPNHRTALLMPAQLCVDDDGTNRGWFLGAFTIERMSNRNAFLFDAVGLLFDVAPTGALTDQVYYATIPDEGATIDLLNLDDVTEERRKQLRYTETMARFALTAICFAHCKGVTLHDHGPSRQMRRAAERAGRPPLVTYKTVDIAPVTRILHEDGHIEKTGIKQALHICRGHFASYTDEAPLFGKYTGTFYRPMHVRGSLKQGAVLKDYRVHPSPETAR